MSYCIRYEKKVHPWQKRNHHRKGMMVIASLCLILLLIGCFGLEKMQLLLPGDPSVTAQALDNMTEALSSGDSLKDAIVTFCQEILNNGVSVQ